MGLLHLRLLQLRLLIYDILLLLFGSVFFLSNCDFLNFKPSQKDKSLIFIDYAGKCGLSEVVLCMFFVCPIGFKLKLYTN